MKVVVLALLALAYPLAAAGDESSTVDRSKVIGWEASGAPVSVASRLDAMERAQQDQASLSRGIVELEETLAKLPSSSESRWGIEGLLDGLYDLAFWSQVD
ncbi:MAG: hypothetical protein AAGG01_11085 [Planctomycetota bacterium]